ncbi:hypothetical protein GOB93_05710 [Acetobacter musti]|uniref:Uncharacterized protein n=1 Tax=Acetobacter musti TaxID=864732 RepID=A0ABX0JQH3_9PROT|nr:hypothetical protein [Acetobacter musti]NHN84140.1 hypothetical protein [Acetobacter musti]
MPDESVAGARKTLLRDAPAEMPLAAMVEKRCIVLSLSGRVSSPVVSAGLRPIRPGIPLPVMNGLSGPSMQVSFTISG